MTRLVRAEVLKLATVRTPLGLLVALALIVAVAVAGTVATGSLDDPDGVDALVGAAYTGSTLATIVGILLITNEFRHGTITQTLLVTPVRERVVGAKLLAGLLAGLAFGLVALGVALAVALPWASARGDDVVWDGDGAVGFARVVGAYALWAALGVAIGAVVRSQVGAIVGTFAWFLIVEQLLGLLGIVLTDRDFSDAGPVAPWLPGSAFDAFVGGEIGGEDLGVLSPAAGLALALAYTAAVAVAGALLLVRRDPK